MEQPLRESEALYRAIGESIDYSVWVCTPDGRNTYITFYPAVMAVALLAGFGLVLLATAASVGATGYWILPRTVSELSGSWMPWAWGCSRSWACS